MFGWVKRLDAADLEQHHSFHIPSPLSAEDARELVCVCENSDIVVVPQFGFPKLPPMQYVHNDVCDMDAY